MINKQLIVKDFGPIKDTKADFKCVTVFIGPTGNGQSTLAKLAAILLGLHCWGLKTKRTVRSQDSISRQR